MKSAILSCAIALTISLCAPSDVYADSATWNLNPTDGFWTTAANWTPATVPNGRDDVATFFLSNQTSVSIPFQIVVTGIVFQPGASAYTITLDQQEFDATVLSVRDEGIINRSGQVQNFINTATCRSGTYGTGIQFNRGASAGNQTVFTNQGGGGLFQSTEVGFFGNSTAGGAMFVNEPACAASFYGGVVSFSDDTSGGSAVIINEGGAVSGGYGGFTVFYGNATAADANVTVMGGAVSGALGGQINIDAPATAGSATFFAEGGQAENAGGGLIQFLGASADNAIITINGGTPGSASGGDLVFDEDSAMDNATCVINGGMDGGPGGSLELLQNSTGDAAQIELFGYGTMDITSHDAPGVAIGSLEGDGIVLLGNNNLTIGSNNLTTEFSGNIQDSGSLSKVGTGTLTLSGANTYTGGTTVTAGTLVINNTTGSGTGAGPVQVDSGTLGGHGRIAGAVTIGTGTGTGAFLAPAAGTGKKATLTIQSPLIFNPDATYTYTYKAKSNTAKTDVVVAKGVAINSGAKLDFNGTINGRLTPGLVFTVISNTSATPIGGTFSNLPDGGTIVLAGNTFQVSYEGGDGNDLTLTVVP